MHPGKESVIADASAFVPLFDTVFFASVRNRQDFYGFTIIYPVRSLCDSYVSSTFIGCLLPSGLAHFKCDARCWREWYMVRHDPVLLLLYDES